MYCCRSKYVYSLFKILKAILTELIDSPAARYGDISGRYIGEDPASNLHISTILNWLDGCDAHTACNATNSGIVNINPRQSPLPTRCIDVQDENLVLRDTEGSYGTYLTLSHRWTQETEKCNTTTENMLKRRTNLDFTMLSKTFQDTITIARRLGIQYVWIDSICIIQSGDNGRDWSREALKMGQYYQYSILTIAATDSSAEHGFLSPRSQRSFNSITRLPYRDKNGIRGGTFYLYKRSVSSDDQFLSSVWNSDLLKRGWVFQEWLLSRRVAYFTPNQVFLECPAKRPKSECEDVVKLLDVPSGLDKAFTLKNDLTFSPSSIEETWYHILEIYSRLNFTMADKDRIIALAGIATEVREVYALEDKKSKKQKLREYVSGLWLRDIHHGLLWEQKKAPEEYQRIASIPSWSWASILLEVKWPSRRKGTKAALEVIGLVSADGARHVIDSSPNRLITQDSNDPTSSMPLIGLESEDWPDTAISAPSASALSNTYDVDNTFTILHIRAPKLTLLQRGPFTSKADIRLAAWATGVFIPDIDLVEWVGGLQAGSIDPAEWEAALGVDSKSKPWRTICSTRDPDVIVGWGSFEKNMDGGEEERVEAIHISTEKGVPGGLAVGSLRISHEVVNVLFVECVGGTGYRRIGVGRVFERHVIREFSKITPIDLKLV